MGFEQRLNDCIGWLVRHGVPLMGASWLEVRGRRSGQPHGLPVNPLYWDGFWSVGCWPCTRAVKPGEDARAGRWAGRGKTECGLWQGEGRL